MQKSTYILINVLLLIFWILIAFISPSYINSIEKEQMSIDDIDLNYFHGRRAGVSFKYNNKHDFAYCRNFMNENMEKFCDNRFPIKNAKVENEFKLSNSEYLNSVNYLRYNNYFVKILLIISFIAAFYFYKRKN